MATIHACKLKLVVNDYESDLPAGPVMEVFYNQWKKELMFYCRKDADAFEIAELMMLGLDPGSLNTRIIDYDNLRAMSCGLSIA